MSSPSITIHKEISSDQIPVTWTVTLCVASAENMPMAIFVTKYTPASKYTGPESHIFNNVAYLDELESIPDHVVNSYRRCLYRSTKLTHSFDTEAALNTFVEEVYGYIQRLITHLSGDGLNSRQHVVERITSSTVEEVTDAVQCSASEAATAEYTEVAKTSGFFDEDAITFTTSGELM